MVELRDAVHQADKDNGDVETALQDLRKYVGSHMNTKLSSGPNAVYPPIQLKYTYERLTAAQVGAAGGESLYAEAQEYCEEQISTGLSGSNRLSCVQQYVSRNGGGDADKPEVPKNLYQFDFASPRWSPDLAGLSLAATALFALAFVVHSLARLFSRRKR
jgi:hypothetical protein